MNTSPALLTDDELLTEVKRLARNELETVAALVAHLVEVEVRDLFRAEGCSSMFTYCTEVLHFSEDAAYMRLQAARLARRFPAVLGALASGALHLSALRFLAPHLTAENQAELISASRHKSKREIEKLVRTRFPLPDVTTSIRKLPSKSVRVVVPDAVLAANTGEPAPEQVGLRPDTTCTTPCIPTAAPRAPAVAPLAAERFKVQFTASASLHDKLRRAQGLLRHQVPSGDISRVLEIALDALIERLEKRKFAATDRPRASAGETRASRAVPASRTIPAGVRRAVWKRDGGRCAFVGNNGRRCSETGFLEFHHVVPFACGGPATIANIALRCRAHNQYEAKLEFGFVVRESSEVGDADGSFEACEFLHKVVPGRVGRAPHAGTGGASATSRDGSDECHVPGRA